MSASSNAMLLLKFKGLVLCKIGAHFPIGVEIDPREAKEKFNGIKWWCVELVQISKEKLFSACSCYDSSRFKDILPVFTWRHGGHVGVLNDPNHAWSSSALLTVRRPAIYCKKLTQGAGEGWFGFEGAY